MNYNLKPQDYIKLIIDLLNIKTNNEITIIDMTNEISKISNPIEFHSFVKENFKSKKYKFDTGYQKFTALIQDFNNLHQYQVPHEVKLSITNFVDKLFNRLTSIVDDINFAIDAYPNKKVNAAATIEDNLKTNYEKEEDFKKALEVTKGLGTLKELLHLGRYGKETLRSKILSIVHLKTMTKHYATPALEMPISQDKLILNRIAKENK